VDWTAGVITRKRSKTRDEQDVPEVRHKLWDRTFALLEQYRSITSELALMMSVMTALSPDGKLGTNSVPRSKVMSAMLYLCSLPLLIEGNAGVVGEAEGTGDGSVLDEVGLVNMDEGVGLAARPDHAEVARLPGDFVPGGEDDRQQRAGNEQRLTTAPHDPGHPPGLPVSHVEHGELGPAFHPLMSMA
jgi:hypothetical protein